MAMVDGNDAMIEKKWKRKGNRLDGVGERFFFILLKAENYFLFFQN